METVVVPHRLADRGALHVALSVLAEQDPLTNLRLTGDEIAVSLYGEVEKEVVAAPRAAAGALGLVVSLGRRRQPVGSTC